jgi:hypothetical protein
MSMTMVSSSTESVDDKQQLNTEAARLSVRHRCAANTISHRSLICS